MSTRVVASSARRSLRARCAIFGAGKRRLPMTLQFGRDRAYLGLRFAVDVPLGIAAMIDTINDVASGKCPVDRLRPGCAPSLQLGHVVPLQARFLAKPAVGDRAEGEHHMCVVVATIAVPVGPMD